MKIDVGSDKRSLVHNISALAILQGANYIIPLVTVPYLVRVLGAEYFGLLAFATALVGYFAIVVDYGFNLSATRDISVHRNDLAHVNEIFSAVVSIRALLGVLCFAVLAVLVGVFPALAKNYSVYLLTFFALFMQAIIPLWLFQGFERMGAVSVLGIISKSIFLILVFAFVTESNDYIFVPLFIGIGNVVVAIISFVLARVKFGVAYKMPSSATVRRYMVSGWYVFLSQFKVSLLSGSNVVILGIITGNAAVGYYSAGEKLMRAIAGLQVPVLSALYPRMSNLLRTNKVSALCRLRAVMRYGVVAYVILLTLVFYYSDFIIKILYSSAMASSALILKIIVVVPLFIFLNNIFGTQIMLNIGKERQFFYVLLSGGVVNICISPILTYFYGAVGAAVSLVAVELLIVVGMYMYAKADFRKEL